MVTEKGYEKETTSILDLSGLFFILYIFILFINIKYVIYPKAKTTQLLSCQTFVFVASRKDEKCEETLLLMQPFDFPFTLGLRLERVFLFDGFA